MTSLGILPPIHLSDEILAEIQRLGLLHSPSEACGVLLPTPRNELSSSQVVLIPNRHPSHHNSYMIDGQDVLMEIEKWYENATHEDAERIAVWHTHPAGNIGPSRGDLQNKRPGIAYLVVTLTEDQRAIPCWF